MANNSTNEEVNELSSVQFAKESKQKASLGKPSKYIRVQKFVLALFAVLAAGVIELFIIILFSRLK